MKGFISRFLGTFLLVFTTKVVATTHYVDLNSTNSTPPFTDWSTAATNIQNALDLATNGDVVLVTNGLYGTGGRVAPGALITNRVYVTNGVTLQSVNGPAYTTIQGYHVPGLTNGFTDIRCVYLGSAAVISGFTLTNGGTLKVPGVAESTGGGIFCSNATSIVTNCVIAGNAAYQGGGACQGTLKNCFVNGNFALSLGGGLYGSVIINSAITANSAGTNGGGVYQTLATNCTVTANSAGAFGGGSYGGTLDNCILYFNTAPSASNYSAGTLNFSCTTPLPTGFSIANITNNPQLASLSHLSTNSPCIGAGHAAYTSGVDIDGQLWAAPPAIGCDQVYAGAVTGALTVAIQKDTINATTISPVNFTQQINGPVTVSVWNFGDGTLTTNQLFTAHTWTTPGNYNVQLTAFNDSNPLGVTASIVIHVISSPILYVDLNSANPLPPYSSWATAATNIQNAVDAASPGSTVLVAAGVYNTGARPVFSFMSNRVAITKPILVQSANGPAVTTIQGTRSGGSSNGFGAVRCTYLTNGAMLSGFTLTGGATIGPIEIETGAGGAVWMQSPSATVSNCIIIGNTASEWGGGVFGGTVFNCLFVSNSAMYGAGACSNIVYNSAFIGNSASALGGATCDSVLNNCTATGNNASSCAGGVQDGTLNNCVIYYNTALSQPNYSGGVLNYSCTTPLPASGVGNIDAEPLLADSSHLAANSPCRGAGSPFSALGMDIDGESWLNPPAIGCDEFYNSTAQGALNADIQTLYTNVAPGFGLNLAAQITGNASSNEWDFGDGTVADNRPYVVHGWANPGVYTAIFTVYNNDNPSGVSTTTAVDVTQPISYVDSNNSNPVPPYSTWNTAATNIQDAVDVAPLGGTVLVTNGYFPFGATYLNGTNRLTIGKPLTVQSINGPTDTIIDGLNSVRCVYVANGASLAGFTLTNGLGGVYCEYVGSTVSNCIITGNSGGGAAGGTVNNCILIDNTTPSNGGGATNSILSNCSISGNSAGVFGGGVASCTLYNCTLQSNTANLSGGGAFGCALINCFVLGNNAVATNGAGGGTGGYSSLTNCVVAGNSAYQGGGTSASTLCNCTVVGNTASNNSGGVFDNLIQNSIIYDNSPDNYGSDNAGIALDHCCTTPLTGIYGNDITNDPAFVNLAGGDYHLQSNSPCINSGFNAIVSSPTDLDGNPRIVGSTVDIGAYEYQTPTSVISYAWLAQYGLPTDGSVDHTNFNGTSFNLYQDWVAGLNPTNPASVLAVQLPQVTTTPPGLRVLWPGVIGRAYYVQRATNLAVQPDFSMIQTNINGADGISSIIDATATNGGPYFYRVGVEH